MYWEALYSWLLWKKLESLKVVTTDTGRAQNLWKSFLGVPELRKGSGTAEQGKRLRFKTSCTMRTWISGFTAVVFTWGLDKMRLWRTSVVKSGRSWHKREQQEKMATCIADSLKFSVMQLSEKFVCISCMICGPRGTYRGDTFKNSVSWGENVNAARWQSVHEVRLSWKKLAML